jgi:hypothetical protein
LPAPDFAQIQALETVAAQQGFQKPTQTANGVDAFLGAQDQGVGRALRLGLKCGLAAGSFGMLQLANCKRPVGLACR